MSEPVQRATPFPAFIEFLANAECETDDDLTELMDGIADTLGDMFGHQSDCYEAVAHFITRLQAAADAAAQTQTMAKN